MRIYLKSRTERSIYAAIKETSAELMVTHNNNSSSSRRSRSREDNDGNVDDADRSESEEMVSAHLRQAKVSVLTALQEQYGIKQPW